MHLLLPGSVSVRLQLLLQQASNPVYSHRNSSSRIWFPFHSFDKQRVHRATFLHSNSSPLQVYPSDAFATDRAVRAPFAERDARHGRRSTPYRCFYNHICRLHRHPIRLCVFHCVWPSLHRDAQLHGLCVWSAPRRRNLGFPYSLHRRAQLVA